VRKQAQSVKELETHFKQRASKNVRSALAWTLIPAAVALVILVYTANQVYLAQLEIATADAELSMAQRALAGTLADAARLRQETDMASQELEQTRVELAMTQAEVARYQAEVEVKTAELQNIQNENETATRKIAVTAGVLASLTKQHEFAKTELGETRSELAQLSKQYDAAKLELEAALEAKKQAQADLKAARADADRYRSQVDDLRSRLNEVQQSLRESAAFVRNTVELDWGAAKEFASLSVAAARLFDVVSDMQARGVRWGLKNTVADGFTSPGFASFVLRELGRRREAEPLGETPPQAIRDLPFDRRRPPKTGDLMVYETGYTMFYFEGPRRPFVLGMTPVGILALAPDFGPRLLGIYRTGL